MALALRSVLASLLAALALAALAAAPAHAACAQASKAPQTGKEGAARKALLCLINAERARHGLRALRADARLRKAATRHSRDMVRRRFFDHTSPSGATMVTRATRAKYVRSGISWSLGENIAWGRGRRGSPAGIMRQWMASAPHRANVLASGMRDAGLGVVKRSPHGGRGVTYTLNVGRRG